MQKAFSYTMDLLVSLTFCTQPTPTSTVLLRDRLLIISTSNVRLPEFWGNNISIILKWVISKILTENI